MAQQLNAFQSLFKIVSAAPHRMMFLGGAVQLIIALFFWTIELTGRYTDLWQEPLLAIPSTSIHIYLMLFGIFPFFTFGFLMTTYPRWMSGPIVPGGSYIMTFFILVLGSFLFYAGTLLGKGLLIVGMLIHILGLSKGYHSLITVFNAVEGESKYHPFHLNLTLASAIIAEALYLVYIATESAFVYRFSYLTSFWLYLMPLLFIVAHRMLPFFTSGIVHNYTQHRPKWSIPVMWTGLVLHVLLELVEMQKFLFIPDSLLLFLGVYHTVLWGFTKSLGERLLAVLHISLLWFSIGMILHVVQSLFLLTTGELVLGRAPLHALAIGFLTSMVVAMGTRVSLGHSGRPLKMDGFTWTCFWGIQLTALIRICAEFEMHSTIFPFNLNIAAAIMWLAFLTPWAIKYGTIYMKPRIDGQPG